MTTQISQPAPRRTTLPPLALALALLAGVPALAQDAAQTSATPPQFGEAIEVSEVLLDVLVTDRDGHVVLGLGPDDFVVEEEGRRVPVTGVSFYSNRIALDGVEGGRVPHPAVGEVPADRHFILFFDDQRMASVDAPQLLRRQFEAARDAERWVEEEMLPGDWVAVVSYDQKLEVHLDFSRDGEAIQRAIQDAARGRDAGKEWPSRRPDAAGPSLVDDLPAGKELRRETTRIYDALRLLAGAVGDVPGRKTLVLFTIGFGDVERVAGAAADPSGFYARPDPRFYPEMEQALNANNVAVYPVDLVPPEVEHVQTHFLTTLAADTGGRYYENSVSFLTPLRLIADENNGYYLLSFQAEHPAGESGYREVEVSTVDPSFQVRAREGYRFGRDTES